MSATIKCDGCGKEAPMIHYPNGTPGWHKPPSWYQRSDEDGILDGALKEAESQAATALKPPSFIDPALPAGRGEESHG